MEFENKPIDDIDVGEMQEWIYKQEGRMKRKGEKRNSAMSKAKKINFDIVKKIVNSHNDLDYNLMTILFYSGMRVSELSHMHKNWVHIHDDKSKIEKVNFIELPQVDSPIKCSCNDCMLRAFYELRKGNVKHNKEWFSLMSREYYFLKDAGRLPELKGYWKPKSASGGRVIAILFKPFRRALRHYFKYNDKVHLNRYEIWKVINRIGKTEGIGKLSPHVLRSINASLWANAKLDVWKLKTHLGWASITMADKYVSSQTKLMIDDMKRNKNNF